MSFPERPCLRATITGHVDPQDSSFVWLYDSARITRRAIRLRRGAVGVLELFNGMNTLLDVQIHLMRQAGGSLISSDLLRDLAGKLDEALFLESPRLQERYAEFLRSPVREPACVGSYESKPEALQAQIRQLFVGKRGPGKHPDPRPLQSPVAGVCEAGFFPKNPGSQTPATVLQGNVNGADNRLEVRGALIPHIDFERGGPTFAWGFQELMENTDAKVFVIIGTSHYGSRRYTLTRKSFRTPLGVAETDENYVNRIAAYYADGVFDDEIAHLPEHSIEFQVVFLQHCLSGQPFRIVPLLVGSFQDCVHDKTPPHARQDIGRMIEALRRAEAESGEKVCYISSGDLAHIGPKFGDDALVDEPTLEQSRLQDHALLKHAEGANLEAFFRHIVDEQDRRRVCGFPPTYTLMAALQPERGRLLHYDQYVEPNGLESVSFASLAFYKRQESARE